MGKLPFLQRIREQDRPLLGDGAMGTLLIEAGLESGEAPEPWNVNRPEKILAIHQAYLQAGAQMILTNSFGASRYRLAMHDLQDQVDELNQAAARLARQAVEASDHPALAAGSIGPSGQMLAPLGTLTFEQARDAFAEQASALAEGGVDLLWIETMSDLAEVRAAVDGARAATDLPIAVTMTFDTNGHTMMGVGPEDAAQALQELDLAAFGANCGNGPAEIEAVMEAMVSRSPKVPLIAKSNAGIPKMVGDQTVYDGTPHIMAEHAQRVRDIGARLIGGCCGSTPQHIQAMAEALNSHQSS